MFLPVQPKSGLTPAEQQEALGLDLIEIDELTELETLADEDMLLIVDATDGGTKFCTLATLKTFLSS